MNVSQRINGHLVHHPALVTFNLSQLACTGFSAAKFYSIAKRAGFGNMQPDRNPMKVKSRIAPLVKGQLWKMNDVHIEIMEVGKTLTHYRLYQNQKRVPISLGGIGTVQEYLKKNKAILVKKA